MMKQKDFLTKPTVVTALATLCCLLWGSAFPAIKQGYRLWHIPPQHTASIILFAGIRFFLAGVLTVLIFSVIGKKPLLPSGTSLKKIGVLSVFQTILQYIFFYLGLAFISGERASVLNGTSVFFALLLSSLVFRFERLSAHKLLGCVVGFAGVMLVSLSALKAGGNSLIGSVCLILSSLAYAFSSVFMKQYSKDENPAMLSGWQFMLGGAVMSAAALLCGGRLTAPSVHGVLIILYLAFLSATAYSLWSILLKYNPVSRVTVFSFMIPVFGYLLSSLFAGESGRESPLVLLSSLALVALGIALVNDSGKKQTTDI